MSQSFLFSLSYYASVGLLLLFLAPLILIKYGWITYFNVGLLSIAFTFQLSSPLVLARLIYRWWLPDSSADYSRSAVDAAFDEWFGKSGFFLFLILTLGLAGWQFYEFVSAEGMPESPTIVVVDKGIINGWLVVLAILVYTWDAVTHKR